MDSGEKAHQQKVVVIRLPANYQRASLPTANIPPGSGPQTMDINQIPDEVIAEMVSSSYRQDPASLNIIQDGSSNNPNIMIDNSDPKQMELYSIDHPQLAPTDSGQASNRTAPANLITYSRNPTGNPHNTGPTGIASTTPSNNNNNNNTTTPSNNNNNNNTTTPNNNNNNGISNNSAISFPSSSQVQTPAISLLARPAEKAAEDDSLRNQAEEGVQYKNYTPKQREWMLVVLAYSRGLLGRPFEPKLQDMVIEKAREVLKKESAIFKLTDRIPTPKTLRGVWKNLWIHPDRTVGTVKKGGRPRIDPELKKRNRNEREKRRRAIMRQQKEMEAGQALEQSHMAMPRRSQRGQ